MGLPKLEGCITVPTGGWPIEVDDGGGGVTVTIPAATYYLSSAGSGTRGMLAELEYQLENTAGVGGAWTVSLSSTTGKVTIAYGGTSFELSWTTQTLASILGFTATLTPAAASFTGTRQATHLFLPNCGRGGQYMAPDGTDGAEESDLSMAISPSGYVRCYGYERRYVDVLDFPQLKSSKTWVHDEATTNESLQKFYDDVLYKGTRFRYHPDATVDGTYVTWFGDCPEFKPRPLVPGWDNANALYSWGCNVKKYVG